ncbi:MAG: PA2169 family four-helix-bundle protein [Cellvibrionaceae bacterium]|nr:PA2169 family four-helix-bundle protein [Cellvibrionaceae bacterium]
MSLDDIETLRELIQTLNDGVEFYRAALEKSESTEHKLIFQRVIRARVAALSYLQPYMVQEEGSPELGHTFGSVLHKMYPDILFGLNSDRDKTLIKQLEVVENETLKAMQKALSNIQSPMLKSILLDLYPRLNRCHDDVWHLDKAC